jgi:hypothetical protein
MLFFIDCESGGAQSPSVGDMTEFGAVTFIHDRVLSFHGKGCGKTVFGNFKHWIEEMAGDEPAVFVSDNPAFDWQWVNFYFHKYFGENRFGHSARRIGDYYAGLVGDFGKASNWKKLRKTKHDHNPVNDATGNMEAFFRMQSGER